ncbi:MAG: HAD-IB family phosphatase [Candidatus Eiseniibacteriota bacterium]
MMLRTAYLCDFDGTVSPVDIGARLIARFTTATPSEHAQLQEQWRLGALGHRSLTEAECAFLRCREDEALEFVRAFELDPDFPAFVRGADARGDAVCVVSEGFEFYIRLLLERAGLGALPLSANRLRFEDGRARPEFPNGDHSCGRCGNCKGAEVRAWRARGYRTVMIGDGFSDRCGAREADAVMARGALLEWCREEGLGAAGARNFAAVIALAERSSAAAGATERSA